MGAREWMIDLTPLRVSPDFRRLWVGGSLSAMGMQVSIVAVLYQVWEMTHSSAWVGATGLAHAVPLIVLGLFGGALADAVDRRALVRWTQLVQLLAALGLAAQALLELNSLPVIFGLLVVLTGAGGIGAPARRTFLPRLLSREHLAAGVAVQMVGFQFAMLVGPAVGGILLATVGLTACYLVDAASFVVSLYAVWRLPPMRPEGGGTRPGLATIAEGLREIGRRPVLRAVFLTDVFAMLLAFPVALFPAINEERFGGDPATLGLFLTSMAVGGIGAGLASGRITRGRRLGRTQFVAAGVFGLAIAGFGLGGPPWLSLGWLVVAGAADIVSVTARGALIQLETPDAIRGRVAAVEQIVGAAGPDLGNARAGGVASLMSAPVALVGGGAACAAAVALFAWREKETRDYEVSVESP